MRDLIRSELVLDSTDVISPMSRFYVMKNDRTIRSQLNQLTQNQLPSETLIGDPYI